MARKMCVDRTKKRGEKGESLDVRTTLVGNWRGSRCRCDLWCVGLYNLTTEKYTSNSTLALVGELGSVCLLFLCSFAFDLVRKT